MRVSVRDGDIGYSNFLKMMPCEAYLNGEQIDDCFTADEEQGVVFVFAKDEHGAFLLNEAKDAIIEKRLTGKVEIRRVI